MYVDNDPMVMAHARALLIGTPPSTVAYLEADLRDPERILRAASQALDFREPVALMMLWVLELIPDVDKPYEVAAKLVDALPSGSYLALSHPPSDVLPGVAQAQQRYNALLAPGVSVTLRNHDEVARFLSGLDIVPPGLVQAHEWRPEGMVADGLGSSWCAVARKL
jgi:hypothetical protein